MSFTQLLSHTRDYEIVPHRIGNQEHAIALPVSFTPYASVKPCSARCVFCSERLMHRQTRVLTGDLRPGPVYFQGLDAVLTQLHGLPMGISLSGLEPTDAPHWLIDVIQLLQQHEQQGLLCRKKVLYTNGSGFARSESRELIEALRGFGMDQVELSRHHYRSTVNQHLMRFRVQQAIRHETTFEQVARKLNSMLPVRLVCLIQRGGIETVEDIIQYLEWAHTLGVKAVVFREFARVHDAYKENLTYRTIEDRRIDMEWLLPDILKQAPDEFRFETHSQGYYYGSYGTYWRDLIQVHFESSDYLMMKRSHTSGVVRKLIYHANGHLCGDWDPEKQVLFRSI